VPKTRNQFIAMIIAKTRVCETSPYGPSVAWMA
jgi:hypothetical protein